MYKAAVRALIRHSVSKLNEGDPALLLRLASADAELAFPGDNTWAAMHRPVAKGRDRHVTHRGVDDIAQEVFARALCRWSRIGSDRTTVREPGCGE
jgi:hypothetical protein